MRAIAVTPAEKKIGIIDLPEAPGLAPSPNRDALVSVMRAEGITVEFDDVWFAYNTNAAADDSLVSDVVSSNLHFEEAGAATTMYGNAEGHYPYGNNLFVYNVRNETLTSLPSQETAIDYLRTMNPTGDSGCPPAHEGRGEKIF